MIGTDAVISPTEMPASDGGPEGQAAVRSHNTIVFHGDTAHVSAGFALALDAMEAHANLLTASREEILRKTGPDYRHDLTVVRRKKAPAQHEAGQLQA
jgi:hypothetical protein